MVSDSRIPNQHLINFWWSKYQAHWNIYNYVIMKNKYLFIKLLKWHFDETIVNRINAMMRQLFDENKNISKLYQWRTSQNYKVALWLHAIIYFPKTNSFATDVGSWWLKRETFIKESSLGRNMMGLFTFVSTVWKSS